VSGRRHKRLSQLERLFRSQPLSQHAIQRAYRKFQSKGVLPDDDRLAYAVISWAKQTFESVYDENGDINWAASIQAAMDAGNPERDHLLEELYDEAVLGEGMIRWAARRVLRMYAETGSDVTKPVFLNWDPQVPHYGGVGTHLLGFPQRLVRPPYEDEARRVLERAADLRERMPAGDSTWRDRIEEAMREWSVCHELPEGELLRDAVLVEAGVTLLFEHWLGHDVESGMRALRGGLRT